MKKKLITVSCALVACLSMLFMFASCKDTSEAVSTLKMNKKYILESQIYDENNDDVWWFSFRSDGTGTFHREYEITFKYTYLDAEKSAVACFFHASEDNPTYTTWKKLLTVSENIIMSSSDANAIYICEDYLKEIPNYRK